MRLHRLSGLVVAAWATTVLGACVQVLGDDFTLVESTTSGGVTTSGLAGSGGIGAGGMAAGGNGASALGGGGSGAGPSGGASTGGEGGGEPACGRPGEPCCETGPECEVLTCFNGTCPEVAVLVQVSKPGGEGTYGIDETEVTRAQYEQWLATGPTVTGSLIGPGCGGKASFAPDPTCMGHTFVCHENCADHPQVCVDWCDAFAYCVAVGKKLCGRVDAAGYAPYSSPYAGAPEDSAWVYACTSGGAYTHSPGDDDGDCRTGDYGMTVPVGSIPTCQSPLSDFDGVYDLTGNAAEWIYSCNGNMDPADRCLALGGNFDSDYGFYSSCIASEGGERTDLSVGVGFRCCEQL